MNMAKIEARAAELHEGCRMPMEQARKLATSEASPDWYARGQDIATPQQPMHCPKDGGECGAGGYCRPEPVQRRPLSDEQINRLDTEAIHGGPDSQYAFRFARAIERAHGIGETP